MAGEDLPGRVFLGAAAEVRDIARPAGASDAASRTPELTVVGPTLNERDNIVPLVELLDTALAGIAWEVIFVDDDSRDDTAAAVRAMARRGGRGGRLQRIGRRRFSPARIEGVVASAPPYFSVLDARPHPDQTGL